VPFAYGQTSCLEVEKWHHGEGTFYGGVAGGQGNCSLPVPIGDTLHAAMNNVEYDTSDYCGACVRVLGPKGSVILKVVDRCPECLSGDIDMTPQAFKAIANQTDGRIKISWQLINCQLANTIRIKYKEGSSQWWIGIQVRNSDYPVETLEYLNSAGQFEHIHREMFNFFINPTGIDADKSKTGPYTFRLTSINNQVLILNNVVFDANNEVITTAQFPNMNCLDCNGTPGGTAMVDNCGVCVNGTTGRIENATCQKDCNGYWNGTAYTDPCGTCVAGTTGRTPCGPDCNGNNGGQAYLDLCLNCVGGLTETAPCKRSCDGPWAGLGYFGRFCINSPLSLQQLEENESSNTIENRPLYIIDNNPTLLFSKEKVLKVQLVDSKGVSEDILFDLQSDNSYALKKDFIQHTFYVLMVYTQTTIHKLKFIKYD
jgi:expansin (peptidoglycan-binding protein)